MKKWLVVFNCQAFGLANCLSLLCQDLEVDSLDALTAQELKSQLKEVADRYDKVIIAPRVEGLLGDSLTKHNDVVRFPHLVFNAFHPDLIYIKYGNKVGIFSAIGFAAYKLGLPVSQAIQLFNQSTYQNLGYFDLWQSEKERLIKDFRAFDIDISREFVKWSRKGRFMHLPNHPDINCIFDLARLLLLREGQTINDIGDIRPIDNLAQGPIFPIFPELGVKLAIRSSQYFKLQGKNKVISLNEFIGQKYLELDNVKTHEPIPQYISQVERTICELKKSL